jgi:hypothetical protein
VETVRRSAWRGGGSRIELQRIRHRFRLLAAAGVHRYAGAARQQRDDYGARGSTATDDGRARTGERPAEGLLQWRKEPGDVGVGRLPRVRSWGAPG